MNLEQAKCVQKICQKVQKSQFELFRKNNELVRKLSASSASNMTPATQPIQLESLYF